MHVKNIVHEVTTNPKIGIATAGTTTTSGAATWLDWIPGDIGKVATLVGMVLSIVLIYTNLVLVRRRQNLESQKLRLEIEIMQQKEADRQAAALQQRRRSTDKRFN